MQTPTVIFGIGTFASVIAGYLGSDVYAYTVDTAYWEHGRFGGKPLVEFQRVYHHYPPDTFKLFIAVTQQNGHRDLLRNKYKQATDMGYSIASFVHPTAYTPEVRYNGSEGVLISPCAMIERRTSLGICTYVRTGAYIGHDCQIGNFVYIAPRACISSNSTVGDGAFIGTNATIRDGITIGENAIVGAGAVVLRDVKPNEVYKADEARLLSIDARKVKI